MVYRIIYRNPLRMVGVKHYFPVDVPLNPSIEVKIWLSEKLCGDQGPWLERNPSCPLCRDALWGSLHWLRRWIMNPQLDWTFVICLG